MTDDDSRTVADALLRRWQDWYHDYQVTLAELDPEGAERRMRLDADTIEYFRGNR